MLSRVADRLYWSARYLERAEGTARIVNAYTQFIMDTPRDPGIQWDTLIRIIDGESGFFRRYSNVTEHNVIKFLFLDPENPGSISASVRCARENLRTTRDVLPAEAWELVNELHLMVARRIEEAVKRRSRYDFLEQVMLRNMQVTGLYDGSMSRDRAFEFVRLGRYLERCDMTTRVIDVGVVSGDSELSQAPGRELSLWGNLLESLSASSAYRRTVGPVIDPVEAIRFAFNQPEFPRSVSYCMHRIHRVITGFSNNSEPLALVGSALKMLERLRVAKMDRQQIHAFIDRFQLELIRLDGAISKTWFHPDQK